MVKKILVVDDDPGIRMLYQEELSEEGYQVMTCGEASLVMDMIHKSRPDLIVMDVKLNGNSGLDLVRGIKKTHAQLPVIICTGYSVLDQDKQSPGADFWVTKHPDLEELKTAVAKAMRGEHLRKGGPAGGTSIRPRPRPMRQTRIRWQAG